MLNKLRPNLSSERQNHARELIRDISLPEWDGVVIISGDGLLHEARMEKGGGGKRARITGEARRC